ncbi:hypothetical protein CR513_39730, partial [Mucuna pruriens]
MSSFPLRLFQRELTTLLLILINETFPNLLVLFYHGSVTNLSHGVPFLLISMACLFGSIPMMLHLVLVKSQKNLNLAVEDH